ncbi:hypothetical protein HAZT_HAZT005531 [Hyalella azteca]|uniref:Uncharacterized protein n=1 Tax=Hyalella azteca TaxID=294128 RepID=A0A6A0HE66_HYAAZ|nr:hypothetical protein HAZT_HAZT005531 [Hyalella azteca]
MPDRPQRQLLSLSAGRRVTSGTEAGGLPPIARLLSSADPEIVDQAVWAIGNIAGDGPAMRDAVLRVRIVQLLDDAKKKLSSAFVYLFVINNVSQFVAMYCLVLFYKAMKDELQPMAPLAKFLCIKCVVFFSFFQGVAIMFLAKLDVIKEVFDNDDLQRISNVLQNFLICIEMFIAAVAHHFAFSYKPYIDSDFEGSHCCTAFLLIWDVSDVRSDIREHVSVVREGVKRHLTGHHSRSRGSDSEGIASWGSFSRSSSGGDERTRLLVPTPSHHTVYCATEAPTASPHCTLMP